MILFFQIYLLFCRNSSGCFATWTAFAVWRFESHIFLHHALLPHTHAVHSSPQSLTNVFLTCRRCAIICTSRGPSRASFICTAGRRSRPLHRLILKFFYFPILPFAIFCLGAKLSFLLSLGHPSFPPTAHSLLQAVAVGIEEAITKEDSVITAYRCVCVCACVCVYMCLIRVKMAYERLKGREEVGEEGRRNGEYS